MKKRLVWLCILGLVAGSVGCGNKGAANQSEVDTTANTASVDSGNQGQDAQTSDMNSDEQKNEENAVERDAMLARYEELMKDTVPIYFDMIDEVSYYDAGSYVAFQKQKPYRFSEFIDKMLGEYQMYAEDSFSLEGMKYTYIDCGMDQIPELAICISYMESSMDFSELFVIKELNGKMQIVYRTSYGYRTYTTLNEYGVLTDGGSSGAAEHGIGYTYIDKEGKPQFVYTCTETYDPWYLTSGFGDSEEDLEYLDLLDEIMVDRYQLAEDGELDTDDENWYENWLKESYYVYYKVNEDYEIVEDDTIYQSDNIYAKFAARTGFTFKTPEEIDKMVKQRKEEVGLTEQLENGKEVEWKDMDTSAFDDVIGRFANKVEEVSDEEPPMVMVDNPSWEYYCSAENPYADRTIQKIKLTQESAVQNDIIDDADWFYEIGKSQPDWQQREDEDYAYHLYGGDTYYPYKMEIVSRLTGQSVAFLDFSNHMNSGEFTEGIFSFVDETIHDVRSKDGILYVCCSHNTYASSAPHNAYIMALDMNDGYNVLWKSAPLTCNANVFAIVGDNIVCGYGFTNEPDYMYVLNRFNGERLDTVKLKTGPDYFYEINGKVYVRTYDMNYVFNITEE